MLSLVQTISTSQIPLRAEEIVIINLRSGWGIKDLSASRTVTIKEGPRDREGGAKNKEGEKKKKKIQDVKPKPSGEGLHKCFANPFIACLIKTKSSETLAVINKPRHIIYCLSYLSNLS